MGKDIAISSYENLCRINLFLGSFVVRSLRLLMVTEASSLVSVPGGALDRQDSAALATYQPCPPWLPALAPLSGDRDVWMFARSCQVAARQSPVPQIVPQIKTEVLALCEEPLLLCSISLCIFCTHMWKSSRFTKRRDTRAARFVLYLTPGARVVIVVVVLVSVSVLFCYR